MRYSVRMKRELAMVKRGGTPSKWLIKRCLKHDEIGRLVFPDLYPKTEMEKFIEIATWSYNLHIKEQFEKQSAFYKMYVGGVR